MCCVHIYVFPPFFWNKCLTWFSWIRMWERPGSMNPKQIFRQASMGNLRCFSGDRKTLVLFPFQQTVLGCHFFFCCLHFATNTYWSNTKRGHSLKLLISSEFISSEEGHAFQKVQKDTIEDSFWPWPIPLVCTYFHCTLVCYLYTDKRGCSVMQVICLPQNEALLVLGASNGKLILGENAVCAAGQPAPLYLYRGVTLLYI